MAKNKTETIQVRVSEDMLKVLETKASDMNISLSSLICVYISKQLKAEETAEKINATITSGKFLEDFQRVFVVKDPDEQ